MIVIFVDMVGNLSKFIDKEVPLAVIIKYYIFYIPYLIILVLPIAMLLASLFSLSQMANHNELTAIKSAGISLNRILIPLFIFGLLISTFALGFGEKIVPPANQEKTKIEDEYIETVRRTKTNMTNIFWRDSINRRVFIGNFNSVSKTARKISIQKLNNNQIIERLDARIMKWEDSTWVLRSGYRRTFSDTKEEAIPFEELKDEFLDFKPEQLENFYTDPNDMSYAELENFIHEVKRNGGNPKKWLVDLHFKVSIPFANFIMVLFGAPLAARRNRGGTIFSLIISILVCLIYYGLIRVVQTLGQTGVMPTVFSAWFANGLFLVAGIGILFFGRK
jgi:lipopolysaccharide export system permease protein